MSKKEGYSVEGLFGTIKHYDSKGHKIGESVPSVFGGYNNYDSKGHRIGETRPSFLGYTSYDAKGHKLGTTSQGFFGTNHYDASGRKAGSSLPGFFGTNTYGSGSSGVDLISKAGAAAALERDPRFGIRPDVSPHPFYTEQALGVNKPAAPARPEKSARPPVQSAQEPARAETLCYVIAFAPGETRKLYYLCTGSVRVGDRVRVTDREAPVTVQAVVETIPEACPFARLHAGKVLSRES